MIRVTRIYDEHREHNGKHLYLIEAKETEGVFFGGFTEYIAKRDLPRVNQKFASFEELQKHCRGNK